MIKSSRLFFLCSYLNTPSNEVPQVILGKLELIKYLTNRISVILSLPKSFILQVTLSNMVAEP